MMLCVYCNTSRPMNEAPCPNCGAPSLQVGSIMGNYEATEATSWRGPARPTTGAQWGTQAFPGSPETLQAPKAQNQQQSLLPVPYHPGAGVTGVQGVQQQSLLVIPPGSFAGAALPVPVQAEEAELIYVPPMYTKPRAVIPRYRAISGLLSLLIVSILLCIGTTYYAKATGKLTLIQQALGNIPPPSVKPTSATLPDPPQSVYSPGPATTIINSATTASIIDQTTATARQPGKVFKVGQTFYLTYSVHPKADGAVVIKWYTNGHFYTTVTAPISAKDGPQNGSYPMRYSQPLEGKIELYWSEQGKEQLAITLYFVVRN